MTMPADRFIEVHANQDDSYVVTYYGVKGGDGYPPSARCISAVSVRRVVTRYKRQFGEPKYVIDRANLGVAENCGAAPKAQKAKD